MQATELFVIVRDIPYHIPTSAHDRDACCHGKSELLCKLLQAYGFSARLMLCTFRWSALPLPEELKKLIKNDHGLHSYVEVKQGGRWIRLDPSLDAGLRGKLPVVDWDGYSNTKLAVIPEKMVSPSASQKMRLKSILRADLKKNKKLYQKINTLYERIRLG
ncbi:hypothetical protein HY639_03055 [Candidatus Woesearchaeota archaeon]|nr:hypothetical protein [Candidatus Woesearchaeota archaeon]